MSVYLIFQAVEEAFVPVIKMIFDGIEVRPYCIQSIIFIYNTYVLYIYACLMQLKHALEIEYNICKNTNIIKIKLNTNVYMTKISIRCSHIII